VVAEIVDEKPPKFKSVEKTELEERQDLWNRLQEFNPDAALEDYYNNNVWNLEKMRTDLKVYLEKERFGR